MSKQNDLRHCDVIVSVTEFSLLLSVLICVFHLEQFKQTLYQQQFTQTTPQTTQLPFLHVLDNAFLSFTSTSSLGQDRRSK